MVESHRADWGRLTPVSFFGASLLSNDIIPYLLLKSIKVFKTTITKF